MLVRFDSKSGTITMFGDVAAKLLRMMGQSGAVPGAVLARDIPAVVQRLRLALDLQAEPTQPKDRKDDAEPKVGLRQRAFPLIELLERAGRNDDDVLWEEERRTAI